MPLLPCSDWEVGWGSMKTQKITCVQLFPAHLKFPVGLIGICSDSYFPTLAIFYPSAYTNLVFLFHLSLSIRIKWLNSAVMNLAHPLGINLSISSVFWIHRHGCWPWQNTTFKPVFMEGLDPKLTEISQAYDHIDSPSVSHSRVG